VVEMSAQRESVEPSERPRGAGNHVKRMALLAGMALAAANVWTGSPLLGLWVGSRVQGSGPPKMGAIFAAFVTIGVLSIALTRLINAMSVRYAELSGQRPERHQLPWMRSMRGERAPARQRISAPDLVLVMTVVIAVAAFEIWFFFFSGSSIGGAGGR
jgi:hypothetical protein